MTTPSKLVACRTFRRSPRAQATLYLAPVPSLAPSEHGREQSSHRPPGRLRLVSARPALSREERMQRSAERILTTHVGSLPRPPDLLEMINAKEDGRPFELSRYHARVKSAVREAVEKQAAAGSTSRPTVRWAGSGLFPMSTRGFPG